ncbi:MAG: diaminobutyrate acetyltransferase [Sandaracinaceae bacterium]|nr:diaminobutyrate acetyltransferase [Sandaracinaceae bacterium]
MSGRAMEAGLERGSELVLRTARPRDGAALHALVAAAGTLEQNTLYCYVLMADHFGDTTVIAERGGEVVGFVMAHRPPARLESVFVWQVGVHPAARGQGIGRRMLRFLAERSAARFVEATVTPSNAASRRLFESLARELGVPFAWSDGYSARALGGAHEPEDRVRIGPLYPRLARAGEGRPS